VEYYEGRRTRAPKNAAQTASMGSKRKQATVEDKGQGYAVSRVSVYRQQVSQFFRCMGDIQLLLEHEMLPLLVADFGLSEQPDFSLESAYILIGVSV
jgi:hypothetical protein